MRGGISIELSAADRERLAAVVADRGFGDLTSRVTDAVRDQTAFYLSSQTSSKREPL